jgi:hypothetical protein
VRLPERVSVLAVNRYRPLLASQLVSSMGDGFSILAVPFAVLAIIHQRRPWA